MDGLSGVASIFAVISLAIQLASTAQDVRNFISSIQDAPKELHRLTNQLEQLHTLANGIKIVVERQEKLGHDVDPQISQGIFKALQTCHQTMSKLQEIVDKATGHENGQNKLSRTWSSIRLVIQKDNIKDLETQLAHGIGLLDLALTLYLTSIHQYTTVLVQGISNSANSGRESCNLVTKSVDPTPLLFDELSSEPQHLITTTESYWRHLTVDSLNIYNRIYEFCKDDNDNVSFFDFQQQFHSPQPTMESVRSVWLRVKQSTDDMMPKNYVLSMIYMLHVEEYLDETPRDDYGGVGIARKRRKSLKRFGEWVDCACDRHCGRSWNFANDLGLSQTLVASAGEGCRVAHWLEKDDDGRASDLKGSYDYQQTLTRWTGL